MSSSDGKDLLSMQGFLKQGTHLQDEWKVNPEESTTANQHIFFLSEHLSNVERDEQLQISDKQESAS